jgi:hypothetical protein
MRKGASISVAFVVITAAVSIWVSTRMDGDAKTKINPKKADELKVLDEFAQDKLNGALDAYNKKTGTLPERAEQLVPEYIDAVPQEAFSHLTSTVSAFDGQGGWVYDKVSFRPNDPQKPTTE